MTTRRKKRPVALLPGKWIRSASGTVAEVTRTVERNSHGDVLYRLRYEEGVRGSQRWTASQLVDVAKRWLKNKPRQWGA